MLVLIADLVLTVLKKKLMDVKNNLENSFIAKVGKHILRTFSMSTLWSFKSIKNNHNVYRGKDCIKMFAESLREHEVINKRASYQMKMQKFVYVCKKD